MPAKRKAAAAASKPEPKRPEGKATAETALRARARERRRTRMQAFIASLRSHGVVALAARTAGLSRQHTYRLRDRHPAFARAWDSALQEATDKLEAEAIRRAVSGVKEPVYQGGQRVGEVTRYSDSLLTTLLKAKRPEQYGDKLSIHVSKRAATILKRMDLEPSEAFEQFIAALALDAGLHPDAGLRAEDGADDGNA